MSFVFMLYAQQQICWLGWYSRQETLANCLNCMFQTPGNWSCRQYDKMAHALCSSSHRSMELCETYVEYTRFAEESLHSFSSSHVTLIMLRASEGFIGELWIR
jgi:hypothetical protein